MRESERGCDYSMGNEKKDREWKKRGSHEIQGNLDKADWPIQSCCSSVRASGNSTRYTHDVLLRTGWKHIYSSGRKSSNNSHFCCLTELSVLSDDEYFGSFELHKS